MTLQARPTFQLFLVAVVLSLTTAHGYGAHNLVESDEVVNLDVTQITQGGELDAAEGISELVEEGEEDASNDTTPPMQDGAGNYTTVAEDVLLPPILTPSLRNQEVTKLRYATETTVPSLSHYLLTVPGCKMAWACTLSQTTNWRVVLWVLVWRLPLPLYETKHEPIEPSTNCELCEMSSPIRNRLFLMWHKCRAAVACNIVLLGRLVERSGQCAGYGPLCGAHDVHGHEAAS